MKPDDLVFPKQGGMSVSPDDPWNLPEHRRPPEFQGVGRDPVWIIDETQLGPDLMYRPDPHQPGHGFVEPAFSMTLAEYQDALAQTQASWRRLKPGPIRGSPPMPLDERIEQAFQSSDPFQQLRSLALELLDQGYDKSSVVERFQEARQHFREADRESEEDVVMDVLDCLVGWCSSQMRLPVAQDSSDR